VLTKQGLPNVTKCRIYAERYDGLPIRMISKNGRMLSGYYCAKNSAAEVKSIIEMGIKKKVSARSNETAEQFGLIPPNGDLGND
jgi:hypothetical protein